MCACVCRRRHARDCEKLQNLISELDRLAVEVDPASLLHRRRPRRRVRHTHSIVISVAGDHRPTLTTARQLELCTIRTCVYRIASFPGPTQLFVACSTEKRGEPGIFSHVSMM